MAKLPVELFGRHDTAEGDAPSGGRGRVDRPGGGTPSEVGTVARIHNIMIFSITTKKGSPPSFSTSTRVFVVSRARVYQNIRAPVGPEVCLKFI